jgi:ATP-dependent DNA helicase MPH1
MGFDPIIHQLQRIGRTGRKRDGRVEVLLAEGREDDNWQTSQDKHKDVQDSIIKGDQLELYGDVKRLIPADVKPTCKEEVMEIQPYVRDEKGKQKETRAAVASGKGKRKRDADPKRNMPEGAILGFLTAKALVPKGKGKKKAMELDLGAIMAEDDDDKDLETPLVVSPSASPVKKRRLSPAAAKTTAPSRKSSVLKKTPSVSKPKTSTPLITGTQLARKLEDDSDDVQIEAGVRFGTPVSGSSAQSQLPSTSPEIPLSKWSEQSRRGSILSSAEADPSSRSRGSPGRGKLLSPVQETDYGTMDLEFDDIEYLGEASPSKNASIEMPIDISDDDDDDEPKFLGARSVSNSPAKGSNGELSFSNSPMSHVPKGSMPPPANPRTSSPSFQSSFPVRAPGQRSKTASFVAALAASGQLPPSSQRQLACQVPQSSSPAPSPPRQRQRQDKGKGKARIPNPYLDEEVEVSGSDQPGEGGHSDTDGGSENEEDRRFIAENPTQAPKGYNQTAAYRQSLFTQAAKNMNFKSGPVRVGAFGTGGRRAGPPPRGHPSSGAPDESLDEYETGSFVADDEEEVQYLGTSSEA